MILTLCHNFDDQNHDLVMIWTIIPIKKLARLKKKTKKKGREKLLKDDHTKKPLKDDHTIF